MKLYMKTTKDELELPLAVARSANELARMIGLKESTVYSSLSRKSKGWAVVEVEDEEE